MGINNHGIFESQDGGESWSEIPSEGLLWKDVTNISLSGDGSKLYASVQCAGVYVYNLVTNSKNIERPTYTLDIYPNPAIGNFEVSFEAAKETSVKILLYDLSGRQLGCLYSGNVKQGENNLIINKPTLETLDNSGVYLIELITDQSRHINKLVIL